MKILFMYIVYVLFIFHPLLEICHAQDFSVRVIEFKPCKGPKRKNCTAFTLKSTNDMLLSDVDVEKNVMITHGKVVGMSVKGKKAFPFQMKKPCDHFFIMQSLTKFLKMKSDCVLMKNHYSFSVNLKEIVTNLNKLIGNSLTGEWIYTTVFSGAECNVFCNHLHLKISPIT